MSYSHLFINQQLVKQHNAEFNQKLAGMSVNQSIACGGRKNPHMSAKELILSKANEIIPLGKGKAKPIQVGAPVTICSKELHRVLGKPAQAACRRENLQKTSFELYEKRKKEAQLRREKLEQERLLEQKAREAKEEEKRLELEKYKKVQRKLQIFEKRRKMEMEAKKQKKRARDSSDESAQDDFNDVTFKRRRRNSVLSSSSECMEATYQETQREEARSAKIARMEDKQEEKRLMISLKLRKTK